MANPWEMDWSGGQAPAPQALPMRQPTVPEMVVAPQPKQAPVRDPLQIRKDELDIAKAEIDLAKAQTGAGDPNAIRQDAVNKLVKVIDQIDYIYGDSADNGGWFETGWLGSQMRDTGGTAAYDLGRQVKTVEASAAFDALQKMREASPTGGALGNVTEMELELLKSSLANLDPNQSQEEFVRSLGVAKGTYLDMLRRLDPALADEIQNRGNPQTADDGTITYDQRGRDALGAVPPASSGSAPPPPPPGGGGGSGGDFLGQFGTSTQNVLAGLAQGAAGLVDLPMEAATGLQRGVNYAVGHGGGALLDMLGASGAADTLRQSADSVDDRYLANRQTTSELIEQASPTPEGMGASRFAAQLLGGAMVPLGPKAPPRVSAPQAGAVRLPGAAREVVGAGRQNNVRVMTSDVRPPSTFIGKNLRAVGERIPYAGTGGPRAAQQAERVQAVKDLAREFGADASVDYLDELADDLSKTRGGRLTALKAQKDGVIDSIVNPLQPTDVRRTLEAIDAQVRRLSGIDATEYAPVIDRLTRFGANIATGKNLRQVEENRKLLGAMFEDASLASLKTEGQKAINAIYNPLREDMGAFIKANGGNAGKWAKANEQLAGMVGELGDRVFKGVLNDANTTPENVAKLLFSKKPSEVRRLVGNLSPQGRTKAQAAIISRALEKAGDDVSPDRFVNEIERLSKSVGVVFEGADYARIKGLEKVLQATRQAGVAAAAPPTGAQNMPIIGGYAAGTMMGPGAIPFLGGLGALARLYESAAVRNMLVGLGKSTPGSKGERQLLERILKAATSQTQIRGQVANDALTASPARAAAEDQELN